MGQLNLSQLEQMNVEVLVVATGKMSRRCIGCLEKFVA
jgi:hypothetical protein